jgi:hypothetical protein
MTKFAVIDNGTVLNVIVADSKSVAEEVTGKVCVEVTTQPAEPGGTYVNGSFIQKQPYPSWIRFGEYSWKAPVDEPTDGLDPENPKIYAWDESTVSWVEVIESTESD